MSAPNPQKPLQGGITFAEVQSQPGFSQEAPEVQSKIADAFFSKHVASQPGFAKEAPEIQASVRTDFNKKYNLGSVDSGPLGILGQGLEAATLAGGAVLNPAVDAFTFGLAGDSNELSRKMAEMQYPGIQNDPGFLGDAYRFNSNPVANNVGGFAGGLANAGKLAAGLPNLAVPAIQSGITNLGQVIQGKQNPLQGLANTAINSVAGVIPAGRNVLTTALKQGAGGALAGAASSAVGDVTNNRAVNIPAALRDAMEQGAIGAGTGAAFHLPQGAALEQLKQAAMPKEPVTYKGKAIQRFAPSDRFTQGRPEQIVERRVNARANDYSQLASQGKINQAEYGLKQLPEQLRAMVKDTPALKALSEGNAQKFKEERVQLTARIADIKNQLRINSMEKMNSAKAKMSAETMAQKIQQQADLSNVRASGQERPVQARIKLEQAKKETLIARRELALMRGTRNKKAIQDAETKVKASVENENLIKQGMNPVSEANPLKGSINRIDNKPPVTLADVMGDALSANQANHDKLAAYDTLETLGYPIKEITRDKNTASTGKQFSVKIAGRSYRFTNESFSSFLSKNQIKHDTIARGIKVRGNTENIDNMLSMIPETELKKAYLEQRAGNQAVVREAEEARRYDAAEKAYDLIHSSSSVEELSSRYNQVFSPELPEGHWEDIEREFDAKGEALERDLSNDRKRQESQSQSDGVGTQSDRALKGEASRTQVQPAKVTSQPRIIGPGKNRAVIEKAIREGSAIELTHEANKSGTRESSTFEKKFDYPYELKNVRRVLDIRTKKVITRDGTDKFLNPDTKAAKALVAQGKATIRDDVPMVRVVNENGQATWRHLEDIKGAVKISDKPHPYAVELDENGAYQPIKADTGERVEQTKESTFKHRDLKGQVDKAQSLMQRYVSGEKVKVSDIVNELHDIPHEQFKDIMKDVPADKIDEIAKELGC